MGKGRAPTVQPRLDPARDAGPSASGRQGRGCGRATVTQVGADRSGGRGDCLGRGEAGGAGSPPYRRGSEPRTEAGAQAGPRYLRSPSALSPPAARSSAGSPRPAARAPGPGRASRGTGGSGPRSRGFCRHCRGGWEERPGIRAEGPVLCCWLPLPQQRCRVSASSTYCTDVHGAEPGRSLGPSPRPSRARSLGL